MQTQSSAAAPERPASHPFRSAFAHSRPRTRRESGADDGDLKLFAVSFTAFFICFYTFLI